MALMSNLIHRWLVRLTYWMMRRYIAQDLTFHHPIVTELWYPFVVQQVRRVETLGLVGETKRAQVVDAVRGRFAMKGLACPPVGDIHLAIEYAVRDHAH